MGVLTPLAIRIGAVPWLPRLLPQITWLDNKLQRLSRGRVGLLDLAGLPNLALTVPGRISGEPRTTPLLCVPDGPGRLVAGSSFGVSTTPAWVHNLRAAETAWIREAGRGSNVVAQELTGQDRERAWAIMCRVWPNFALYERRADRLIPVFRLAPASASDERNEDE